MTRKGRSLIRRMLLGLLALSVGYAVLIAADTSARIAHSETAGADRSLGLACDQIEIPVKLSKDGLRTYQLVGDLCYRGQIEGKIIQVLVTGTGYGPSYWDSPFEPERYSYVRAATAAGFATFNFARLGLGESERPFGLLLSADVHADRRWKC